MPFFHAEPLFKQKYAVLGTKQTLLEGENLHKNITNVQFLTLSCIHSMTDGLQKTVNPLLFHDFQL